MSEDPMPHPMFMKLRFFFDVVTRIESGFVAGVLLRGLLILHVCFLLIV